LNYLRIIVLRLRHSPRSCQWAGTIWSVQSRRSVELHADGF